MTQSASALTADERARFLQLVDRRFGIRGTDYAASRIDEAVMAVLAQTGSRSAAELLEALDDQANPRWLFELVEHLTVGETYFMRDAGQIAARRDTILPEVIARRQSQQRLRLWSAGCSTGEEVYSLAILLSETRPLTGWDITLIGTDVNRESLRLAREASYPAWSFRATSDRFRDRYFEPVAGGWKLIDRTDEPTQLRAFDARHEPVADDDVGPLGTEQIPGFGAVGGGEALVTEPLDRRLEHHARGASVLDHHDLHLLIATSVDHRPVNV